VVEAAIGPIFNCFVSDATEASRMVVFARFTTRRSGSIVVTENQRRSDPPEIPAPPPANNARELRKKARGAGIEPRALADDVIYTTNLQINEHEQLFICD
jgi:hypothetical protein